MKKEMGRKENMSNPFPKMEKEVLSFWEKGKIFKKSVTSPQPSPYKGEGEKRKDYVFYDGPPFATGEPHYGHIVASLMKDAVPRYWTMKGYRVERKWGWDCHGLPIENIAEKELGIKKKKDIEEMGVEKFNEFCRSKVLGYVEIWKKIITRLGRWADMENSYKTMDLNFMESVWWVFRQLWDRGLIYEGYRSMHICPRCETTLSQQEVVEGYKMIKDWSVVVKFEIATSPQPSPSQGEGEKIYILAWTTTPWTLIGNVALAVGENVDYLNLEIEANDVKDLDLKRGDKIIISNDVNTYIRVFGDTLHYGPHSHKEDLTWASVNFKGKGNLLFKNLKIIKGKDLVGLKYKPLFDYYVSQGGSTPLKGVEPLKNIKNGWKIYPADFVTTEEGTGVVHIAPAFGEDDMNLGKKYNLPFIQHVNMDGTIKEEVKDPEAQQAGYRASFAGLNVKPIGDTQKTDAEIIKYLAHNNLLFAKEKYEHSYPHCWRCETPLINYATSSWFVNVSKVKSEAMKLAKKINWSPKHIKEGRFGKWLEGARDWSISRQRYWASVMPIWRCQGNELKTHPADGGTKLKTERKNSKFGCDNIKVFGSVKELEDLSGEKITDLHKHIIDKITFKCEKCGGTMKRVPDVLDCWFESGSMPYAQTHYPFENKEKFEKNFPAEFIAEGVDQTRAWFYYLHVISTAIKKNIAYKNVIVNGIVLAEDGKKMSKRLKNYPDPTLIFEKYGADAMRFYLLTSPVMTAENLNFSEQGVKEALQKNIMLLWNVYRFYEMFADNIPLIRGNKGVKEVGEITNPPIPPLSGGQNILDQWILARLNELIKEVTKNMDAYDLPRAVRPITEFINDLSTWYIRRSRNRFKGDDENDKIAALKTTKFILIELAKIMAPFTPFIAEQVWQKVSGYNFQHEDRSVHLEAWPVAHNMEHVTHNIIQEIEMVRKIVEMGLAKREEAGIKIRQPLFELRIKNYELRIEYEDLIKDELNVKSIKIIKGKGELSVKLDLSITEKLKIEGIKRELVRFINALRKDSGMTIKDRAVIRWETKSKLVKKAIKEYEKEIMKDTLSDDIREFIKSEDVREEVKIGEEKIILGIKKLNY